MNSTQFPKKIWFLWFQGKNNMPEIVEMCYQSWLRNNHAWEVVFLDDNNLSDYLDFTTDLNLKREDIPLQAQSDIIRINLLKKYGGVWVDSTCYCNTPLDNWLGENMKSGFFAFNQPRKDKMISSWFLASTPQNKIVEIYCQATNAFWQSNPPNRLLQNKGKHSFFDSLLLKLFSIKPTLCLSDFSLQKLKISHYFWFHFLFEKLYKTDIAFKEVWDATPKISAEIPHLILRHGFNQPATPEFKAQLKKSKAPLYKLNWREQFNKDIPNSAIATLKEMHKSNI